MRSGAHRVLGAVALALALTGCGDDGGGDAGSSFTLPVGDPSYDAGAPTWAVRGTIHVGKDAFDVEPAPQQMVSTSRGIYYLSGDSLYLTDGGPAEKVAPVGGFNSLHVSPDGHVLGLLDTEHGPTDEYGTHVGVPVAFDLRTGEEVLRPAPGSSLAGEDLADLYEDDDLSFRGLHDGAAYAADPLRGGLNRFPLDGGEPSPVKERKEPTFTGPLGEMVLAESVPGGGNRLSTSRFDGYFAVLSPTREALFLTGPGKPAFYDPDSGARTGFDAGEKGFRLGGWLDDDTFYGAASRHRGTRGPIGATRIVTCSLERRACSPYGGTFRLPQDPTLLFADGSGPGGY